MTPPSSRAFVDWNARVAEDGRLVPNIARPDFEGESARADPRPSQARRFAALARLASPKAGVGGRRSYNQNVIYCVIPPELADELYDKMVETAADNPNVTVIIDRRTTRPAAGQGAARRRAAADARPSPAPGTFPDIVEG